jgi:ABC-type glycerol-3-phosphate transport system substrate-binding protein
MLLARAASYAKHPDYFSALFQTSTMDPLIDSAPFVRALEEMVEASRGAKPRLLSPEEVRKAFWQGTCALAITWPSATAEIESASDQERFQVGFCQLPGATQVFNPEAKKWEPRGKSAAGVPLLSIAGRIGSVARDTGHKQAAFELLAALSGTQWSPQVSATSPATTLFRTSHLTAPREWVERPMDQAAARDYATLASEALSRQDYVAALPLPGRSRYLAALDEAVGAALREEESPQQALQKCSRRWQEITDELGRDAQQAIYRQSVVPAQ